MKFSIVLAKKWVGKCPPCPLSSDAPAFPTNQTKEVIHKSVHVQINAFIDKEIVFFVSFSGVIFLVFVCLFVYLQQNGIVAIFDPDLRLIHCC